MLVSTLESSILSGHTSQLYGLDQDMNLFVSARSVSVAVSKTNFMVNCISLIASD